MALSADERRRLDEMSTALAFTDPDLDRTLATGRFRRRRAWTIGTALVVCSGITLTVGACLRDTTTCLVAWALFAVGMLMRFNAD